MYRDGPERERARCEEHGLTYDPAAHDGCTLCRREKKKSYPVLFAVLGVLSLLVLGVRLALYWKSRPPPVPTNVAIGGSCQGGPKACVAGADCLSESGVISLGYGRCVKRCASDAECGAERCRALPGVDGMHCVSVTQLGERCSGMSVCEGGDCVLMVGKGAWCLKQCGLGNSDCPPGTTCQLQSRYCVPFP